MKKRMNQKRTVCGKLKDKNRKKITKQRKGFTKKILLILLFLGVIAGTIIVLELKRIIPPKNPYIIISGGATFLILTTITLLKPREKNKIESQKKEEGEENKPAVAKSTKYQTDLDKLYELVERKGKVKLQEAAKKFKISMEKAEEWAKILENHDMIKLNYPAFGEVELCKKP